MTPKTRVLVVEDDPVLSRALGDNLAMEGFDVRVVNDGHEAVNVERTFAPDLVLLDAVLPGKDGFELCRLWREGRRIPIIMLTARGLKADKLRGLRLGADDYITKPFDLEELFARIDTVLRRVRPIVHRIVLGASTIDFVAKQAWNEQGPIELSHREFELLRYLAERAGGLVYRDELLQAVWGFPSAPNTRAIDSAIARLRKKIEADPHRPRFIHTARSDGYCLTIEPRTEPNGDLPVP